MILFDLGGADDVAMKVRYLTLFSLLGSHSFWLVIRFFFKLLILLQCLGNSKSVTLNTRCILLTYSSRA